jgi:DNA helicase-2/ATP-dependent DNA helicase PcrA
MEDQLSSVLDRLTEPQRQAVVHAGTPLLVLAGPGSGKTRVITHRIAHLVACGESPASVLALTFTNKAAGEMRRRVQELMGGHADAARIVAGTFHSFGARVLRRYAERAGVPADFTVLDADDQAKACKQAIGEAGEGSDRFTPKSVLAEIGGFKDQLIDPAVAEAQSRDWRARTVARIYAAYQKVLARSSALDFDDLLCRTARLLRENEEVRDLLQSRFRNMLVDEYQDTNHAQFCIVHELARGHRRLCVVGDPDQSIYGWRGADLRNILQFEQSFPDATVIPLGENFRSVRPIVDAASALIQRNRQRRHKELRSMRGDGDAPVYARCIDERSEALRVVRELESAQWRGVPWKGMAVLYRMNSMSRVLEEALRRAAVPHQVVRGTAFYDRREVRDLVAYLRLAANPQDELALGRVANVPARGLGDTSLARIELHAVKRGLSLVDALRVPEDAGVAARAANAARKLAELVLAWRREVEASPPEALGDLVGRIARESGLEAHYLKEDRESADEGESRVENLAQVVSASAEFVQERLSQEAVGEEEGVPPLRTALDALRAFLERIALVADSDAFDPETGAVTLMTLHAAKGLEFPLVCMVGLEQGSLPHARSLDTPGDIEEERRLCFVGMTRAEDRLLLTGAASRTVRGQPMATIESMFVRELPPGVTREDATGDFGDPGGDPGGADDLDGIDEPARRVPGLRVGTRVRHPLFGVGVVEAVSPRGGSTALRVAFAAVGRKTLIQEFARLQVIG